MLTMPAAISEFERELIRERQREGIAIAKANGKYKGRKPKAQPLKDQIMAMVNDGKGDTEIGKVLGLDRTTVFRIRKATSTA